MTAKEVREIVRANPGKALYVTYEAECNVGTVGFFDPTSMTRMARAAKHISAVKYGKYIDFRPDLKHKNIMWGDQEIVLFELKRSAHMPSIRTINAEKI